MTSSDKPRIGQESSKTSRSDKPRRRRIPLAGMGCRWFAKCALLLLMFCTAPALVVCAADVDDPVPGENGPQRRRAVPDDTDIQFQRKARALPSRDSDGDDRDEPWRIRIETPDGVFLIYDVAIPATEPREKGGYVAYWGDKLEATLYQYDRLLLDSIDVGHALVNLSRDLLIDVSALAASDPWLQEAFFDALEEPADPTVWIRPVQSGIAPPKGFIPATDGSDGGVLRGQRGGPTNDPCPVAQNSICISDFDGNETCSCVLAPVRCLGACCNLDCDDRNVCTTDGCALGVCSHAANTLPCADDNNLCTIDVCDNRACTHPPVAGNPACTDDGNECTDDICSGGACTHPAVAGNPVCTDDGNECTDDMCSGGACTHPARSSPCTPDSNPCTSDFCSGGVCTHPANSALCNDGNACTTNDRCSNGSCSGTDRNCNDNNECTTDSCNSATGCAHSTIICDDDDSCTENSCDQASGCFYPPLCSFPQICCNGGCCANAQACCDDGLFCNGQETCVNDACQSGDPPCPPGKVCNEATETCDDCTADAECDDGAFCNGSEACVSGGCQAGADPCPGLVCDEGSDTCSECVDSDSCDDGDPCTEDVCSSGECTSTPMECDNDTFCDGEEFCSNGECQSGSVPCAAALCDETTDSCNDCTTDGQCDDGEFCNGSEICVSGSCEFSDATPCPMPGCDRAPCRRCDENLDDCVDCFFEGPCYDPRTCTEDNICVNGTCTGVTPIDCSQYVDVCETAGFPPPSPNTGETEIRIRCDDGSSFCNSPAQSDLVLCLPTEEPLHYWFWNRNFEVWNRIVSHLTPRKRYRHGMLKLSFVSGDSTAVDFVHHNYYYGDIPYALDTQIPLVLHWFGRCVPGGTSNPEYFTAIPRHAGEVTIRARLDPDPECCEGDGVPTVEAEITIRVALLVDLDIDSDNNNGDSLPDRTTAEDEIEDTAPGKLMRVNNDDDDGNGVPDMDQEPPPVADDELVPMQLDFFGGAAPGQWQLEYDSTKVQIYEADRETLMPPSGTPLDLPTSPQLFWIEALDVTPEEPTTISALVDLYDDGIIDCVDSVVVSVFVVEFETFDVSTPGPDKPHELNVKTNVDSDGDGDEDRFYDPYKKSVSHVWSSEPLDMAQYLDGYDEPDLRDIFHQYLKWRINDDGEGNVPWQEDYQLDIGPAPGDDAMTRINIEVAWQGETEPRDHLIVTVVPPATQASFNQWYVVESADTAWLLELPAPYTSIVINGSTPVDPEPDDCSPQRWYAPVALNKLYHPGAKFEMRSKPTAGDHGHQATYDESGNLILVGLAAGTADRAAPCSVPPFFCDPHVQADVLPFIRAAQMDGNPVDGGVFNIDLSGPIMHFGYYLQQYLEVRPIVPNGNPEPAPGTCPQ